MIESGAFEVAGVRAIGMAGHPQGHPNMDMETCFNGLEKCEMALERGMGPIIVNEFGFDTDAVIGWLETLRDRGNDARVTIGVPGPTSIASMLRFASRCGLKASASVLTKYGLTVRRLLGKAAPGKMILTLAKKLTSEYGLVGLHFYPFGELEKTVDWINAYARDKAGIAY